MSLSCWKAVSSSVIYLLAFFVSSCLQWNFQPRTFYKPLIGPKIQNLAGPVIKCYTCSYKMPKLCWSKTSFIRDWVFHCLKYMWLFVLTFPVHFTQFEISPTCWIWKSAVKAICVRQLFYQTIVGWSVRCQSLNFIKRSKWSLAWIDSFCLSIFCDLDPTCCGSCT